MSVSEAGDPTDNPIEDNFSEQRALHLDDPSPGVKEDFSPIILSDLGIHFSDVVHYIGIANDGLPNDAASHDILAELDLHPSPEEENVPPQEAKDQQEGEVVPPPINPFDNINNDGSEQHGG